MNEEQNYQQKKLPVPYQTWFIMVTVFLSFWPLAIYLSSKKKKFKNGDDTKLPGVGFYIFFILGNIFTAYFIISTIL